MELSDEGRLHEAVRPLAGSWQLDTEFGTVALSFIPERVGYGSKKGVPDEIVHVEVKLSFWGKEVVLRAPILLEAETSAGLPGALLDLRKYEERSIKQERARSDLLIPMIVVGTGFRGHHDRIHLIADVEIVEAAREAVPEF